MKFAYLFLVLFTLSACVKDTSPTPILEESSTDSASVIKTEITTSKKKIKIPLNM